MAFLGLRVPHETARLFGEVDFGGMGDREDTSALHVTLLYLGKNVPIEDIARLVPVVFSVTAQTRPFTVSTDHVTTFPPNPDDGVPIICRVQSNDLHGLRAAVTQALDAAGIEYNKKYPDYKPHVTVGYSQDPNVAGLIDKDFPAITWGAHELVLWGGDSGDNRLIITFPFSLSMSKEALDRTFVQVAQRWAGPGA